MDVIVEELKRGLEAAYQLHIQLAACQPNYEDRMASMEHHIEIILQAFHNCNSMLINPDIQDSSISSSIPTDKTPCFMGRQLRPVVITTELKDDGHKWRKYGKKPIISSKYPREYFRCRFRENGCRASKYVQMICDYPTIKYGVVYFGSHTCEYLLAVDAQVGLLNFAQTDPPTMLSFSHPSKPKQALTPNVLALSSSPKRHKMIQEDQKQPIQHNVYSPLVCHDLMAIDRSVSWSHSMLGSHSAAVDCSHLMADSDELDNNEFSFGH